MQISNTFISKEELKRRKTHNQNINRLPEELRKASLTEDKLIINLYAFEDVTKTKSKLIELQTRIGETAGGVKKTVISQDVYQARGVVLLAGKDAEYKKGDIVWLNHRNLFSNSYDLLLDRSTPVAKPKGLILVPSSLVQLKEGEISLPRYGNIEESKPNPNLKTINDRYA